MILRRIAAALALAALALLGLATPAFAHAELTGSSPAKGSTVSVPPQVVTLTFNEPVSPLQVTVTGPGTNWTIGQISVQGAVVTVPVQPLGPPGAYVINYTVRSEDGDDVFGTVDFTMSVAATTTPPPTTTTAPPATTTTAPPTTTTQPAAAPAEEDSGGVPAWIWIVLGAAALVTVVVLIVRRARTAEDDIVDDGLEDEDKDTP
ncbi:MAG TPA: copper resistance CopC family protein [Actinophytocola sp.]|uniref:copper resistance CopC family protein n=1 Tax=Actinophytocola sp. TaxID=1872138 RepID=UPI002DBB8E4F|nr:copper resistance CopC family protein [Actinophytocola sp.]HEU5474997.1 copper resistance CopC family protein [Actinophytocola sp.]